MSYEQDEIPMLEDPDDGRKEHEEKQKETRIDAFIKIKQMQLGGSQLTRKQYFVHRQFRILLQDITRLILYALEKSPANKQAILNQIHLIVLGIPIASEYKLYTHHLGHSLTLSQEERIQKYLFEKTKSCMEEHQRQQQQSKPGKGTFHGKEEKKDIKHLVRVEQDIAERIRYQYQHEYDETFPEDQPIYSGLSIRYLVCSDEHTAFHQAIQYLEYETQGSVHQTSMVCHSKFPYFASLCRGFLILNELPEPSVSEYFKSKTFGESFYPLYFVFQLNETTAVSLKECETLKKQTLHKSSMEYLMMVTQRKHCLMVIVRRHQKIKYILVDVDLAYQDVMIKHAETYVKDHLIWKWIPSSYSETRESLQESVSHVSRFSETRLNKSVSSKKCRDWLSNSKWEEPYDYFLEQDIRELNSESEIAQLFGYPPKQTKENELIFQNKMKKQ